MASIMTSSEKNCLVICGPTASGKTSLGVALALELKGEILSADSRQIYRGMDIGTGKDLHEYVTPYDSVPYHLIDICNPSELYTLYHYQRDFYAAFRDIHSRSHLPIVVGGTGLYIEAVLKHYRIPNVPEDPSLRKTLMCESTEALRVQLKTIDPALFETTDTNSKKRVVRSLEIALYGQDNEIRWSNENPPDINPLVLVVGWPREELHARIDRRLQARLAQGMAKEVENILHSGIPQERFNLFGMEYKHIASHLDGTISYKDMVKNLRHAIFQLAKRQDTWFRGMERRGIVTHRIDRADQKQARDIIRRTGL